jgi:hypothetical protein
MAIIVLVVIQQTVLVRVQPGIQKPFSVIMMGSLRWNLLCYADNGHVEKPGRGLWDDSENRKGRENKDKDERLLSEGREES